MHHWGRRDSRVVARRHTHRRCHLLFRRSRDGLEGTLVGVPSLCRVGRRKHKIISETRMQRVPEHL